MHASLGKDVMRQIFYNCLCLFAIIRAHAQTDVPVVAQPIDSKVYTWVETPPRFPGGDNAMIQFMQAHLHYPQKEMTDSIEGRVLLKFEVTEDGSVTDVHVIKSVNPVLDAEAVRVVKMLPKFIPGKNQGRPVKVSMNMPVEFRLTGYR